MKNPDAPTWTSPLGAMVLGGAHGSLEIARSLGRRKVPVWLLSVGNTLARGSRFVARHLSWPGPRAPGALRFLFDLVHRHGLHGWVLLPGSDEDLRFVAQNHDALGAVFRLTTLPWDKIRWALDKRLMTARAAELGISRPATCFPRSRNDLAELEIPFPVILKATVREHRNKFCDAKAWRVDDAASLVARYDEAKSLVGAERIMIQEFIPGDGRTQFSYAAVWDRGKPVGSLVARRRRQYPIHFGFTSTFVETTDLPEVEAAAVRFLGSLEFSGLAEIEFKHDARDGTYKILDVNARAWTWMALGAAAGIDFPELQWRLATGLAVTPNFAARNAQWIYFSRDFAASVHELYAGRLSPIAYLRSMHRSSAYAAFAWDDPWPAGLDLLLSLARCAKRRLVPRRRDTAASLHSIQLHT